ncbi:hypothetical protein Pmani_009040 [Petrolisthes manimaculis]|uniref:Protein wntless n=1 Tax=Petrolisthes manimaculis TaxID=1843537 RepID=A0AAE1UIV1_9EUCA|nr:hypothetical protein Pmani_009040 [Petrolisthes manimaculis]
MHRPIPVHSNTTSHTDTPRHIENAPTHKDTYSSPVASPQSPTDNITMSRETIQYPQVASLHPGTTTQLQHYSNTSLNSNTTSLNPKASLHPSSIKTKSHYPNSTPVHTNRTTFLHSNTTSQHHLPVTSTLSAPPSLYPTPLDNSLHALPATTSQNASLLLNTSLHNIVFAFQFPGQPQGASRWQQRLAGLLRLRLVHHQGWWGAGGGELSLETRLGYSDQPTAPPALLAHTVQARHVSCNPRQEHQFGGATYHCAPVPLVVLYSLYHPHYLVNIRLEGEHHGLTHIQDLYVSFISQDGRYTRVLVALQTLFFPTLACLLLWYLSALRQPHLQPPPPTPTTPTPYTANTVTTAIPHTATTVTTAIPYTGPTAIRYSVSSTTAIMVIPNTTTVTTVTAPDASTAADTNTTTVTSNTTNSTTNPVTTTTTANPRIIAFTATSPAPATSPTTATTPPAPAPVSAPATLTYFQIMLLLLASALLLVNCPWTYLTLVVDCPWLVILQELCLGLFYASFMTFLHFLTHLYLEPVNRCPKVRTAMARVIGGYAGALLLVECTEHWLLLHNPLPASWESLHLGLATITILLVIAYLAYITIRVYAAMKVLRRRAGRMKRDLHQVSWNLSKASQRDTGMESDQEFAGISGQRSEEKDSVKEQTEQKEQPSVSEKIPLKHLQTTDSKKMPPRDKEKEPQRDIETGSLRETMTMPPTYPEMALRGQEKGFNKDTEKIPLRGTTVNRPQWEVKNGGAWCELVDDKRPGQGWWREGGVLLVSWVCVLLTATEFIIKRLHDGMWIWEDIFGNLEIENTSGLLLGVYSAWNVFTCVALLAYPPHPPPSRQPHTPTIGEVEVITEGQPIHQQEQQRIQTHQWSGEERRLCLEGHRHWQLQRPPLVRQDAIDIVSLDSLEGVVMVSASRAESQETEGGVMRLAVLSADGLISNDDAVSVYLISADSVASAEATLGESLGTQESEVGRSVTATAAVSNSVSAISSNTSGANEAFTTYGNGESWVNTTDTVPNGDSDSGGMARSGRGRNGAPSLVLVNGVDARSIDDDGSDIGMIDDPDCDNGGIIGASGADGGINVSGGAVCDIRSGNGANSGGGGGGGGMCSANDNDEGSSDSERVMNGKASFGSDNRSMTDSL